MRYKDLLMLSVLWGVCASTMNARDLLACEYTPSERIANGRFGSKKISPTAIYRRYLEANNYDAIHPVFKEWIEQNKKNYRYLMSGESLLYINDEDGIGIYEKGGHIFLYRTRFFGDDQAWEYQKEPAINPFTDRPWIELTASELKSAMRGGQKLSEEEQQFLKDVLSILNENFHYYYGMQLIDLGRNTDIDKAQLMGKFIPPKMILFGENAAAMDLSSYTEQQAALYQKLGHPIYSYEGILSTPILGIGSDCGGKGGISVVVAKNWSTTIAFHNQVSPDEVNPSFGIGEEIGRAPPYLNYMVEQLEKLCEERGANVRSQSMNKTPLARSLYLIHKKTKQYVEALVTHEYVANCRNKNSLEEDVNHLYDVVPIKGLTDKKRGAKSSSRSSSKKKMKSGRAVRKNQRTSRERS